MKRFLYILWRVASDLVSLFSRAINAFLFGGSSAQTLSARAHLKGPDSSFWDIVGRVINGIFFWQENHIRYSFREEYERALHTVRVHENMMKKGDVKDDIHKS